MRITQTGRKKFSFAQTLSIINNESGRVFDTIYMIFGATTEPFEIIYCAFFIYYYVGVSVFAGLALWLFRIGFVKLFEARKMAHNDRMNELQTERV